MSPTEPEIHRSLFTRERLYCPGPTPVPTIARLASLEESVYHRSETFTKLILSCRAILKELMGAMNAPVLLTSSGTGAMEAAVTNFTDVDSEVLVVNGGNFGERWVKLNQAYGCKTHILEIPWGTAPTPEDIVKRLQDVKNCRAIFLQANETSTGVYYPVREIANAVRMVNQEVLLVVDCISSLVAHPLEMHKWDLDVVTGAVQKGFGVPPGLAFVAVSERAHNSYSGRPRFYFDLRREEKGQAKGETAWTPAVTLVQALAASLSCLQQFGFSEVATHHARTAEAVRRAGKAMNLQLLAPSHHSNAVTAFRLPENAKSLVSHLERRYGAIFAGGQGKLAGQIFRFAHLGFLDTLDLMGGISAVEMALNQLTGAKVLGKGIEAAANALAT